MVKGRNSVRRTSRQIGKSLGKAKRKIVGGRRKLKTATKQILKPKTLLRVGVTGNSIKDLANMAGNKGFRIEYDKDFGTGPIDLVWNIDFHPALAPLRCGFVKLTADEGGSNDLDDGQFSLRKIEEAVMRGIRSGMDRLLVVCDNEDLAKSVTGKIEWLSSFGSLLRFDTYASGLLPSQQKQAKLIPSQRRVPAGEKI